MDNNVDSLGGSDDDQQEPESENVFPPVEPVGQPDTPSPSEPEEQPVEQADTPPVAESYDDSGLPPLPDSPDKDERLWATFCHLAAFAGYFVPFIGQIIGPLVVWLIKKEESPFVDVNGKKALNFQISIAIYMVASIPLACGGPLIFLALIPLIIVDVIFTIIAAIKANNGEEVSYPISINIIK